MTSNRPGHGEEEERKERKGGPGVLPSQAEEGRQGPRPRPGAGVRKG